MLLFELVIIQSNFAIGCSDQDPPVFYLDISDPVWKWSLLDKVIVVDG